MRTDASAFLIGCQIDDDFGEHADNRIRIDNIRLSVAHGTVVALHISSVLRLACRRRRAAYG
jgi:hypothetical protein